MKIHPAALSLCALLAARVASAQIVNGGFELGSGTQAASWTSFGNVFRDTSRPHGGLNDLKLFGNFNGGGNVSGAYQDFPIAVGERVAASAWAINRNSDPMSGDNYAVLKVIYRDVANHDLASSESKRITAATARDAFQLISTSLGPAPVGTHHASVFLLFIQAGSTPNAAGSALFDDVQVQILSAPKTLVWRDEFDGTALSSSNWEVMIGDGSAYGLPGWGNNELQYYTSRPVNLLVGGGLLRIIARREAFGGAQYTSARIRSKGKHEFLYGRMEARMKVPAGQGLWPAFWMLPSSTRYGGWASSGEIDILETINTATEAHGTIHFGGSWPNNVSAGGFATRPGGYADGFHVYAVEWEPDAIRWYVDGVEYYARSSRDWYSDAASWNQRAPFDEPFHVLLNLAVGGNWPGNPDGSTLLPAELVVDYVRVFQAKKKLSPPSGARQAPRELPQ
jgi:beta-glucanase (GH16 family)